MRVNENGWERSLELRTWMCWDWTLLRLRTWFALSNVFETGLNRLPDRELLRKTRSKTDMPTSPKTKSLNRDGLFFSFLWFQLYGMVLFQVQGLHKKNPTQMQGDMTPRSYKVVEWQEMSKWLFCGLILFGII